MTVPHLAEAIRRARDFSGESLGVVVAARAVACPRCGSERSTVLHAADSREFAGRRCAACGLGFRVVVASSADLVAAVSAASGVAAASAAAAAPQVIGSALADELRPTAAQRHAEQIEIEAAAELTDDDLAEAARALQGWRVRLASIRTRKLLDDEMDPRPEDIELLARAVLGRDGNGFVGAVGVERGVAAPPRRVG